ncbi:HAMP domain-containing histidine kinase, partial [Thermodesulfovibrionales bacterium]|nr:HAMP domain-containing histidine kinase [Thermodesulfovibrionales bacterium]
KSVPLQLIGTVDKSAVTESFIILLIIYLSVGGAIILIIIVQNSYLAPRLTAGPASRPVNEVESQPKTFVKVPHELKAMLNSIVSNAEMAASREVLLWPNKKGLEDILTDAKGMLLLIESLQYLSMIESGQKAISPEGFILCDLIGEIEVIVKDLIGTKEIELIVDCDALLSDKPIYTDRGSLKNLLVSLVSNAIRHTDVGTITLLSVKEMINGTEQIEITIADTGKGIKPEALKQEADASLYHPEFSGLAIAKRLAAAIDGKIEGESIADRGSVLTAIIPLKKQKNGFSPNLVEMR